MSLSVMFSLLLVFQPRLRFPARLHVTWCCLAMRGQALKRSKALLIDLRAHKVLRDARQQHQGAGEFLSSRLARQRLKRGWRSRPLVLL